MVIYEWRGDFDTPEVNVLHAEAFGARLYDESGWSWRELVARHSLGWVTARLADDLVGFVNVVWDGLVHAWIQDVMVATQARREGVGTRLVAEAARHSRAVGCEWLHVDFVDDLQDFHFGACGFEPTNAGLLALDELPEGQAPWSSVSSIRGELRGCGWSRSRRSTSQRGTSPTSDEELLGAARLRADRPHRPAPAMAAGEPGRCLRARTPLAAPRCRSASSPRLVRPLTTLVNRRTIAGGGKRTPGAAQGPCDLDGC